MSRGIETTLKTARKPYKQSGTSGRENGTVPKLPRPIMLYTV